MCTRERLHVYGPLGTCRERTVPSSRGRRSDLRQMITNIFNNRNKQREIQCEALSILGGDGGKEGQGGAAGSMRGGGVGGRLNRAARSSNELRAGVRRGDMGERRAEKPASSLLREEP